MKQFIEDFKAFAIRGNVIDLAVAVVIGGAFGKIVTSLVENVIMPSIGVFLGGVDFTGYTVEIGNVSIKYGTFIQSIVDFTIVAFVIFLVIRALARFKKSETVVEESKPKEPSDEVKLLTEIRDNLRNRS